MFSFLQLTEKKHWWTLTAVFFVLMLITYGKSLGNDFVLWDDSLLIFLNPIVQSITPTTIKVIFSSYDPELYIPLTLLSFQLDWLIGSGNPAIFHITSLVLHTVSSVLLVSCVKKLTGNCTLAILTGLLFALHPLNTEAIAWASGRKDVLSVFFFLLSLLLYLHYRENESKKIYWISVFVFLLGLLSKAVVVSLPFVLLLCDYLQKRADRKMLIDKIPYFALSIVFTIVAFGGKAASLGQSALSTKLLMVIKAPIFYIQKLLVPYPLMALYPYHDPITLSSPAFFVPFLILIAILLLGFFVYRKARIVTFAIFFYFVTLAPSLLNFDKEGVFYIASDRYAYIPSIAFFLIVAFCITSIWQKYPVWKTLTASVTAVIFLLLMLLSFNQSMTWNMTETLFLNVLKHEPRSHVAHNNIGDALLRKGQVSEAIEHLSQSLKIHESAEANYNLGLIAHSNSDLQKAEDYYMRAINYDTKHAPAHLNLGAIYADKGEIDAAIAEFSFATVSQPFFETP